MAGEQNLESAKRAYAAFSAGDAAGAMANMADDIEWVTPGNSTVSGTLHGKQEIGAYWGQLAERGFTTQQEHWFNDEDRVVVLCHTTIAGDEADTVDVLTFSDGKLVKFQTAADTAALERHFGTK
jgi:ketosteroid isomerase-like protein